METSVQRWARLITALEDLAAQEAATLQSGRVEDALGIQERAAPLVQLLAAHTADVFDATLRVRIATLLKRRRQTDAWLEEEIESVRGKLQGLSETQFRVARVAPAYGRSVAPGRRQLSALG
ncbi:MAG: hypothetical protein ACREH8_22490 [Opitutaceae bacterium]